MEPYLGNMEHMRNPYNNNTIYNLAQMMSRSYPMLELKHETINLSNFCINGYFNYSMKIHILSMLVNLIISSFHRLKVHLGAS